MFQHLLSDLRHGLRQLRPNPGFAALAIATLALGIGANTALFSVVHAILIKPLPYREPERLARVWMDNRRLQMREDWASWLIYQDYKRLGTSFEQMAAFANNAANLTSDGEPERVFGVRTEAALFDSLGSRPLLGRLYTKDEEGGRQGRCPGGWMVVVAAALWREPGRAGQEDRDGWPARDHHRRDAARIQVPKRRQRIFGLRSWSARARSGVWVTGSRWSRASSLA